MATAPVTVTIKVPDIVKQAIAALQEITVICQQAEESGKDSVPIAAIGDILENLFPHEEQSMSKRYLLTLKNGNIEDIGAESIDFTPTHIVFESNNAETLEYAIRAELVDTVVEENE